MASDRGMVSGGLTRRALVLAAPSLLVPTVVLAAVTPTPGGADICFRWEGPLREAIDLLARHAVEIVEGPVPRPASNGELGKSVYFRDPDQNLMELLTIHPD